MKSQRNKEQIDPFWREWTERFEREKDLYITPNDPSVMVEADKVRISPIDSEADRVMKLWNHIRRKVNYDLSRVWFRPHETISNELGDCEDLAFLFASMAPNVGIDSTKIHVGMLEFQDGEQEEHVWNTSNGILVDLTGRPRDVAHLNYHEIKAWEIKS